MPEREYVRLGLSAKAAPNSEISMSKGKVTQTIKTKITTIIKLQSLGPED